MTNIYAVANQKGGVGKTTTVINLAAYLADAGLRTLVVDLDPQANATSGLGIDKYSLERSVYDLLLENCSPGDILVEQLEFGIDVLPSHPSLAGAEVELVNDIGREYRVRQTLAEHNALYDYVLIDCPPSLGLLTVNALTAAGSGVLIPVQCEYLALEGLTQLNQTIELVQRYLNPRLTVRGMIMTMYDSRTNLSRQVVEEVRRHFPGLVFSSIIPRNIRLSEAPSYGQPISHYAPISPGAMAYKVLASELRVGDKERQVAT